MSFLRYFFPKPLRSVMAHASSATKDLPEATYKPLSLFTVITGPNGKSLDLRNRMVVVADGSSLSHVDIDSGDELLVRESTIEENRNIPSGSVVVVNAAAQGSNSGRRLRIIEAISGDIASFKKTADGKKPRDRNISEIESVVEFELAKQ
jgi:hypothetical protein